MATVEEIKVHKNKETQRFLCAEIHRDTDYLVVAFRSEKEGRIQDIIIPQGSTTIAHYWADRGYVLWRMSGPDGTLIGTLFHICKDVTITDQYVRYLDLIVDIWIAPDGTTRILDEDELAECSSNGLLTDEELRWVDEQKQVICSSHEDILRQALAAVTS
jgi:predicted RNA-binding protein associated with RNAse of E/G family